MAQLNSLIVTGDSRFLNTINGNITSANGIHRATMESTSTATAFVLTADDIDSLYDGLIIYCKNTVVNSAANCTINLNGLGAKRIWVSQDNGYCTTHWSKNQAYLFVYNNTDSVWELQQGRNTNSDTYDRNRYNCNIKCGATAIVAANIIVATDAGLYHHLKDGTAFDIRYPILYANGAISANGTGTNNYDIIHFTVTTTQSISMTAYLPVYIKGTLSGTTFTPVSTTPLTQTAPSSADGYHYMKLGVATAATTLYLQEVHPIYAYKNGKFGEIVNDAMSVNGFTVAKSVPSNAVFTDNNTTYTANNENIGSASAGTAIPADDITAWSAGTATSASVSKGVLTITNGTAPSLSYTAKSIPNITVSTKSVTTSITAH